MLKTICGPPASYGAMPAAVTVNESLIYGAVIEANFEHIAAELAAKAWTRFVRSQGS